MAAVEDQYPVQQFAADSSIPLFGDRVCLRCPHRGALDANPLAGEHGVEHAGERAVAVPNQEGELSRAVTEVYQTVPCLLGPSRPLGLAVTPRRWIRRVACSTTNSTYSRCSSSVSTQKKSVAR